MSILPARPCLTGKESTEPWADPTVTFEPEAGELLLDGERIALTPLEFAAMSHLHAKRGKVVTRVAILRDVWGYNYEGGSNVVDSVIRAIRKRLGSHASSIETVRGFGYRSRLSKRSSRTASS